MRFSWDPEKNRRNLRIHKLTFEDASKVFDDTNSMSKPDPYPLEERWRTIGAVGPDYPVRGTHLGEPKPNPNQTIRIISARKVTPRERAEYEQA